MARYNLEGLLPDNPAHAPSYKRHYSEADPRTQFYALWDYPRLAREIVDAERRMWARASDAM